MDNDDFINYGSLIDDAMHIIVKRALEIVVDEGLPGNHHFFISFLTEYPGVEISQSLLDKYPEEMTIVLQYQFQDLDIDDAGFGVSLSFDNVKEHLYIPFAALTAFADPSVKFGLQFRHIMEEDEDDMPLGEVREFISPEDDPYAKRDNTSPSNNGKNGITDGASTANVITLDSFRKK